MKRLQLQPKFILTFFVFVAMISTVKAQTEIGGGIFENTTLTLAESPYLVTDDLTLFPDFILTIEPGVELIFDGDYTFEIRGQLIAIGTENLNITFTTNDPNPSWINWEGIELNTTQGAEASFEYCIISNARQGVHILCCNPDNVIYFKHCQFIQNGNGIDGTIGGNILINIDDCEFSDNSFGINSGYYNIRNSTFLRNSIGIAHPSPSFIYDSYFADNRAGLAGGSGSLLDNCLIEFNEIGIGFEGGSALSEFMNLEIILLPITILG